MLSGGDCSQARLVSGALLPPLVGQRYCNAVCASRISLSAEAGGAAHLQWLRQGCQTAALKHFLSASAAHIWKRKKKTANKMNYSQSVPLMFIYWNTHSCFNFALCPFVFFFFNVWMIIYVCVSLSSHENISPRIFLVEVKTVWKDSGLTLICHLSLSRLRADLMQSFFLGIAKPLVCN